MEDAKLSDVLYGLALGILVGVVIAKIILNRNDSPSSTVTKRYAFDVPRGYCMKMHIEKLVTTDAPTNRDTPKPTDQR